MIGSTNFCRGLAWAMDLRGVNTMDLAGMVCNEWNTEPESARRRVRRYKSGSQSPKLETVELLADVLHVCPCDLAFGRAP